MPAHHDIVIRFLRKGNLSAADTDDVLTIHKFADDRVNVTYTERESSDNSAQIHRKYITYDQLDEYLWNTFWAVSIDEDPFKSVQLSIPGHPSILVTVATLKNNLDDLLDIVSTAVRRWPVAIGA